MNSVTPHLIFELLTYSSSPFPGVDATDISMIEKIPLDRVCLALREDLRYLWFRIRFSDTLSPHSVFTLFYPSALGVVNMMWRRIRQRKQRSHEI